MEEKRKGRRRRRKERKRKKNKKQRRRHKKCVAPFVSPLSDTFPSAKLGNNMTPIKGRLGKNTTPTSRDPIKLNQNL